jgi:serine/threonine protein kinase
MSLAPGFRLGPYEILAAIGAGGMGEVYRARDTRLDRTVAIKVLPDALVADQQLRDRLATPVDCDPIYGRGELDGRNSEVMRTRRSRGQADLQLKCRNRTPDDQRQGCHPAEDAGLILRGASAVGLQLESCL